MSETMVERVARALSEGGYFGMSIAFWTPPETESEMVKALARKETEGALAIARVAIEAMREPLWFAALDPEKTYGSPHGLDDLTAYMRGRRDAQDDIDAALSTKETR